MAPGSSKSQKINIHCLCEILLLSEIPLIILLFLAGEKIHPVEFVFSDLTKNVKIDNIAELIRLVLCKYLVLTDCNTTVMMAKRTCLISTVIWY